MKNDPNGLPPDAARKWITQTEAAALLNVTCKSCSRMAKRLQLTTYWKGNGYLRYYLYSEVESLAEFYRMRRAYLRKYQVKGRLPRCVEKMEADDLKMMADSQKFVSRKETAVLLNVSMGVVSVLVYRGRLVAYQTCPGRRGCKMWFSRRAVLQLKEDPERLRAQQIRRGEYQAPPSLVTGKGIKKARHPRNVTIPPHLMTAGEAAERLGLSYSAVRELRMRGRLRAEKLWQNYKPLRYWYILVADVERLLAEREEREKEKAAKARETPLTAVPTALPPRSFSERPSAEDWEAAPEPRWACDEGPGW